MSGVNEITAREFVATQAGAWTVLPAWYPAWRISTQQEALAVSGPRPTACVAYHHLRTGHVSTAGWRGVYSGIATTAALQPLMYPTSIWISNAARKHLNATQMQGYVIAGSILSPLLCGPWKTWVMASTETRSRLRSDGGVTSLVKAISRAPGWWAVRNAVVVPCLFEGPRFFRDRLGMSSSATSVAASAVLAGVTAAIVSHPCDLVTGMLNGDPFKRQFANSRRAIWSLLEVRGLRGIALASPARVVHFSIEAALLAPTIDLYRSLIHSQFPPKSKPFAESANEKFSVY